jgi:hypothetical protein
VANKDYIERLKQVIFHLHKTNPSCFFDRPFNAHSLPGYRPTNARQV